MSFYEFHPPLCSSYSHYIFRPCPPIRFRRKGLSSGKLGVFRVSGFIELGERGRGSGGTHDFRKHPLILGWVSGHNFTFQQVASVSYKYKKQSFLT